jgi:hypothetical protein
MSQFTSSTQPEEATPSVSDFTSLTENSTTASIPEPKRKKRRLNHALSGVFRENQALIEAIKCLEPVSAETVEELDVVTALPIHAASESDGI